MQNVPTYNIIQLQELSANIKQGLNGSEKVGFKIQAMKSGQNTKDYILNEQQATLLVTFLKNTEQVANFKTNLVKAFFKMREELSKFRM